MQFSYHLLVYSRNQNAIIIRYFPGPYAGYFHQGGSKAYMPKKSQIPK
jgi:hypothetical protein